MANPVIRYTSRTYNTILSDINSKSELRDKPSWWKKIWAGVGDVMSMILNAQANQCYLETAFTDSAVDRLLALIDYNRTPQVTSSGIVLFYVRRDATFPFTVEKEELIAFSQGSISIASKRYEAIADQVFAQENDGFTTDYTTDKLTVTRAGKTGELVRLTSTGTLPAPLSASTDYYLIYVSATEVRLAATLEDAYNGTYIALADNGSGAHTMYFYSVRVTMYQRETKSAKVIGTSDGTTEWQEYDLPDVDVLRDTIRVIINGMTYTRVDTFVYSESTDQHFKVIYNTDGTCKLLFGNGVYGMIPPAFDIYAEWAVGGGSNSNITVQNKINSYGGADSNITGVSNSDSLTGGSDRQSTSTAKAVAPVLLKSRDRFVTVDDGESLVTAYGGVARVRVNPNVYGVLSCQVVIVPNGGGIPSGSLLSELDDYLTDRCVLESIDVRCVAPTYITTNVAVQIKMESGYSFANIREYAELACLLFVSEVTNEIKMLLDSGGIDAVVAYINDKWTYSFTSEDYTQIETLVEKATAVNFGDTMQESNLLALIDSYIDGVAYVTCTVPTFPVTLDTNEITTEGTILVTEIV